MPKLLITAALILSAAAAMASPVAPPSGPARPASPAPAPATPPAPVAPAAPDTVAVPEVVQRAEEVAKLLRDFDALLVPSPSVVAIDERLPEVAERIAALSEATTRALDAPVATAELDELTAQARATRAALTGDVETLARSVRSIEETLERLTSLSKRWTRARMDARISRAPGPVIERIDGVLAAIGAVRDQLLTRRAVTLVLQDQVAREVAQTEAALARIAGVRVDVAGGLFTRDSVLLWDTGELARGVAELPARIRSAAAAAAAQLAQFAREQRWSLGVQLAVFLALAALMGLASRTVTNGGVLFARPVSAALLLTVLMSAVIYPPGTARAAAAVAESLALVPALRLMPRLKVLAVVLFADVLRHLAAVVPLLEQQIFLLEMLVAIAVLIRHIRSRPEHRPFAMRALLAVFIVALGAGIAGYMTLGLLLGAGVVRSGFLALVISAAVPVADGLVSLALRVRPLSLLASVERHRPAVERRAHAVLRIVAVAAWAALALRYFGLWTTAVDLAQAALAAELKRGALSVTLGDILVFIVTVGALFVLSGLMRVVLEEDVFSRVSVGRGLPSMLSTLLHYAIVVVGFVLALAVLGVDLTKITILAGAVGVGIGFGLQGVVNNFVSGLILLVERRIDVGDAVQIGDVAGEMKQMGMRACTVRTPEGAEVIVPNAALVSEKVANWTPSRVHRIDVAVSVTHGTSPEKVMDILRSVARAHKQVLLEPAPVALFLGPGDGGLRLELRVWTDRFDLRLLTQSELTVAVYETLRASGVEMASPQCAARIRS